MDCNLSGFSVHGIFQAIVLEWIAISFSSGSSQPRYQTQVSHTVDRLYRLYRLSHRGSPILCKKKQKPLESGNEQFSWIHRTALCPDYLRTSGERNLGLNLLYFISVILLFHGCTLSCCRLYQTKNWLLA